MSDLCERWKWRDPGEIIERLLAESTRAQKRAVSHETITLRTPCRVVRDAYYTQARRLHIQKLMKGRA